MEKRVQILIERGNGPRVIMQDLLQKFPQWKDEIKKQCSTLDEEALIAQYWADEIRTGNPKKLFDTLIRKGFSYEAVTRISKSR
jgi:SOS response regulatory protein OraA/RecX